MKPFSKEKRDTHLHGAARVLLLLTAFLAFIFFQAGSPQVASAATGTFSGSATLDGNQWNNTPSFSVNYTGPSGTPTTAPVTAPFSYSGVSTGTYSINWVTPPAGVTYDGVTPFSQTLFAGGNATFVFHFKSISSIGTFNGVVFKDGQPWNGASFSVTYTVNSGTPVTAPVTAPFSYSGVPTGTYSISGVSNIPSGVIFDYVTPYSQPLSAGGTATFAFYFKSIPSTGTFKGVAFKDGKQWYGAPFSVNYTGPSGTITAPVTTPFLYSGVPTGTYSINGVSNLPAGITFDSVSPSSQTLYNGSTATFTFNFKSISGTGTTIYVVDGVQALYPSPDDATYCQNTLGSGWQGFGFDGLSKIQWCKHFATLEYSPGSSTAQFVDGVQMVWPSPNKGAGGGATDCYAQLGSDWQAWGYDGGSEITFCKHFVTISYTPGPTNSTAVDNVQALYPSPNDSTYCQKTLGSGWQGFGFDGLSKIQWCKHSLTAQLGIVSPPATGTIKVLATKDGVSWNTPPFTQICDAPSGDIPCGTIHTDTLALPQAFTGKQPGTYTVKSITPPAGVTLQNINGSSLPYGQTLTTGGTITFTYNFVTVAQPTGTIILNATKDNQPWYGAPPFTISGNTPNGPVTETVNPSPSQTFSNQAVGQYSITIPVTPPAVSPAVTFSSVTRSASQTLTANGTIIFTINFVTTVVPPSTGVLRINATKDGVAWDSPAFTVNMTTPVATGDMSVDPAIPYQEISNSPAGLYQVNSPVRLSLPAGVTLKNVNGNSFPYGQTLVGGSAITFTFNFVTIPPSLPDLVISVPPSLNSGTLVAGDILTFKATVKNQGGADAIGTFNNRFRIDLNNNGVIDAGDPDLQPYSTITNLAAGASQQVVSAPWTAVAGTYRLYACADRPPAPPGVIAESDENNNCAWGDTITVANAPVPTLVVSPFSWSMAVGDTKTFKAIYDPGDGLPHDGIIGQRFVAAAWTSSDPEVAWVDALGTATGKSPSFTSVKIRANFAGRTASADLTVTAPVPTLVVSPSSASVAIGNTTVPPTFTATYDPDGSGPQLPQDVTGNVNTVWSPSDATKVTVSKGLATRVGHGLTSISASYPGVDCSASGSSCSADIVDPAQLRIIPSSAPLKFGEPVQLKACLNPNGTLTATADCSGASEAVVTTSSNWSPTSNSIASVNNTASKGLVTAGNTEGLATISAAYTGLTASAGITVTASSLSVSCSVTPASAVVGDSVTWTATATGGTGSYSYSWSGSSPLGGKTGKTVTVSYPTNGTKTGSVKVTSGSQTSPSTVCSNSVDIKNPLPLSVATLTATPSSINKGDSSTLTWTSTNDATRCDSPDFSTNGLPSNTSSDANPDVQVSPTLDTTYHIYCTNANGVVGPTASAPVTVVPVTTSIKASPTCINGGGNSKISWSATPSNLRCDISGPGLSRPGLTGAQLSGSQTVSVFAKSTYTIACTTNGGTTVPPKSVIVDVSGCWSEF